MSLVITATIVILFLFETASASSMFFGDSIPNMEQVPSHSAFIKFMELNGRGSSQGAACYGDYLFVGNTGNRIIDVYDLVKKCLVSSIMMPDSNSRCHANTLNFGTQFYQKEDEFPLLYIPSGYRSDEENDISNVFVYRLEKSLSSSGKISFHATLVQTIDLQGFRNWTESVTDNVSKALWIRYDYGGKLFFLKYPEPDFTKPHVTLTPFDLAIIDTIQVEDIRELCHIQGMLCEDGYITYSTGMSSEVHYWIAINLDSKEYEYLVNLYEVEGFEKHTHQGLPWEPEYVFTYKGDYYLGFRKFIYKMDLEKVRQSNFFFHRYHLAH